MFLVLARFHARSMSYKALMLASTTCFLNEKGEIRIKEGKSLLPVDVRGSKTSITTSEVTSKCGKNKKVAHEAIISWSKNRHSKLVRLGSSSSLNLYCCHVGELFLSTPCYFL